MENVHYSESRSNEIHHLGSQPEYYDYTSHTSRSDGNFEYQPVHGDLGHAQAHAYYESVPASAPSSYYTQDKPGSSFPNISSKPISRAPSEHYTQFEYAGTGAEDPLFLTQSTSKPQIISTRGHNWNLEIGALVISFGALAALIALLIYVDGRPLSDWKGSVSVNVIISGLGAVSRTSLGFAISSCLGQAKWNWFKRRPDNLVAFDRFDEASRGPWGSLWLIIWLRIRHWIAIGALVTILLMAFEPFLQAVISFPGQSDPSADSPMIQLSRSENLDVGSYTGDPSTGVGALQLTPSEITLSIDPFLSIPDLGMLSSFNNGFYNSSRLEQPTTSFTCPTANCTWPVFTSLAVCSSCSNITDHVKRSHEYGSNKGTLSSNTKNIVANYTINSLPSLNLSNPADIDLDEGKTLFSQVAFMSATRITDPKLTLAYQNLTTMITAVEILRAAQEYETGELIWDKTPVSATECALYFCANAYESVVEKGVLTEKIVASWAERDFGSYRNISDVRHFDDYEKWNNYSLFSQYGDFQRSDLVLFIPDDEIKKHKLPEDVGRRFNLTENTIGSTVRFVNDDLLNPVMTWPVGMNTDAVPVAKALYQSQDLSATFNQVAWTVSNWMREISNATAPGVGEEWVIHIRVNWYYMILPLITLSFGFLFCIWTIIDTHRLRLNPWKTSLIATLTHSVDVQTRTQLRDADKEGYLKKSVRAMTVKFEDVGYGLELRTKQA
ncbi:uncharacterized protein F4812DRAFT_449874 [Daldinia caldariorum]|uniref:uncharacterized protein n=1 Tax=Daldinia caldariorum TaxID=326644 RepID=UPI00200887CD|nr:uncharacterized protein F4812DRAFT_449874 [Daldinia caldariorum]KAI1470290.1 hypothetical protein F4812DRAFT_449874 [Daldinia caldariorum]